MACEPPNEQGVRFLSDGDNDLVQAGKGMAEELRNYNAHWTLSSPVSPTLPKYNVKMTGVPQREYPFSIFI